mgnify:CR=1 FL=1
MIKLYNKDSSSMAEVKDGSVQLCVKSFPLGHLTVQHDDPRGSALLRLYAVQVFHDVSSFLFSQSPKLRDVYMKQLGEIVRVLKSDGVFVFQVGNAVFDSDRDLFGTELSVLYPYIIAEDFVLSSPLRLRFDIPSVVRYPNGERRVEHWFGFSKQEKFKHKKIPLFMHGNAGITRIEQFDFSTSPENILRKIIVCIPFSHSGLHFLCYQHLILFLDGMNVGQNECWI